MCTRTSVEALLEEHGQSLHSLVEQHEVLERRQAHLTQEALRRDGQLHELRREHRQLLKDFHQMRDEYSAVRDCLTGAKVVSKPNLELHLSRRRAPRVLKRVVEEPGLAITLGCVMGVMGSMRLRETSQSLSEGLGKCLKLLKKRMPPDIYVLGGKNDSAAALSTVECFNPLSGEWHAVPPMMVKRYGCAAATLGGLLYVVGGHDGQKAIGSAERFDPSSQKWSRLPNMLTPRSRCAAVPVQGRLHILGGRAESRQAPQALPTERFDPTTCKWEAALVAIQDFGCRTVAGRRRRRCPKAFVALMSLSATAIFFPASLTRCRASFVEPL